MVSMCVLAIFVVAMVMSVVGIIVFNIVVGKIWYEQNKFSKEDLGFLIMAVSAGLNVATSQLLNTIYIGLAHRFTDWENHQTETQYEDALAFKTVLFGMASNYSALLYVAFFKGNLQKQSFFGHFFFLLKMI